MQLVAHELLALAVQRRRLIDHVAHVSKHLPRTQVRPRHRTQLLYSRCKRQAGRRAQRHGCGQNVSYLITSAVACAVAGTSSPAAAACASAARAARRSRTQRAGAAAARCMRCTCACMQVKLYVKKLPPLAGSPRGSRQTHLLFACSWIVDCSAATHEMKLCVSTMSGMSDAACFQEKRSCDVAYTSSANRFNKHCTVGHGPKTHRNGVSAGGFGRARRRRRCCGVRRLGKLHNNLARQFETRGARTDGRPVR